MKRRIIIDVCCILFIALLVYIGVSKLLDYRGNAARRPIKTGLEGKLLPSFKLLLVDSTTYLDTKNIPAGSPVVFFYFSPRCPYCEEQMEEIRKSVDLLKDVRFYLITPYPFSEMKIFYERHQLKKYANIIVGADNANFFGIFFREYRVPFLAVYGSDMRLKQAFVGNIPSRQIRSVCGG